MDEERFEFYLIEHGKAQSTIRFYIRLLANFLKTNEFTDETCRRWLVDKTLHKSASCRNKYVNVFKNYGRFKNLEFVEQYTSLPEHPESFDRLTTDELWQVIELVPLPDRMSVLLLTLANSGCRVNEALMAQKRHLSYKMIRIKSKTQEIRKIAIHEFTYQQIQSYLQTTKIKSDYLFPNYKGKKMTSAGVLKEYRRRLKILKINKNTRIHDIRHSYMNRQHKNNPLRVLQEQVGHKKLTTTQRYTHPDEEDLLLLASRDTLFAENVDPFYQLEELIDEAKKRGFFKNTRFEWKIGKKLLHIEIADKNATT